MVNVCVIGLGTIGLPLALVLAKSNHRVIGVDTNAVILNGIRYYQNKTNNVEKELLERYLDKQFFITNDLADALVNAEIAFIAIGTGISPNGVPDLSNLFNLVNQICLNPANVKGKLFVLKSTLPVGTTREIASLIERATGLQCGFNFYLAFCPERVLGNKAIHEMEFLPKVIGGMNKTSSEKAALIYESIGGKIIVVESPEAAELIKLMDNAYRQTMFAFSNDFALLAENYGINATQLVKLANDSYPRNSIPLPSPGVSGYCLTKDPLYLEIAFKEIANKRGFSSVWYSARKSNDYMPLHMIELLNRCLVNLGKNLKDANVMVCGISYKENTDDTRHSHGVQIATALREGGANVYIWDPRVSDHNLGFQRVENPMEVIGSIDALVFTIKHDEFIKLNNDGSILCMIEKMRTPIIIDGWGMFQQLIGIKGVYYSGVGIPNKLDRD